MLHVLYMEIPAKNEFQGIMALEDVIGDHHPLPISSQVYCYYFVVNCHNSLQAGKCRITGKSTCQGGEKLQLFLCCHMESERQRFPSHRHNNTLLFNCMSETPNLIERRYISKVPLAASKRSKYLERSKRPGMS